MYELTIESTFAAAHAISIAGDTEPIHGHNWHVTVCVAGAELDADGLLVDFHVLEERLRAETSRFHNTSLNETRPFHEINPTAENVARHLGEHMSEALPPEVHLAWTRVSEAPGCTATYRP